MAEFCLRCFGELSERNILRERDVLLSKDEYLCEGCGEMHPIVVLDY